MNWRQKTRVLLVLLLAFLASASACAGISVEGSLSEENVAQPGDAYHGVISVRNTGKEPVEVKLYQTDYAFGADGRNEYGQPGSLARSNAPWVRLGQQQFLIPPGAVVNASYQVSVPADDRLNGTYWSMVMVEPLAPMESATKPRKGGVQLAQVIRYAVQIVTDIGSTGRRALSFVNPVSSSKNGKKAFSVDIENTGERWLRPQLWMELYDTQGRPVKKIDSMKQRIYPGMSARFPFDLSQVGPGRYRALIVADGGGDDLFGTEMTLELK